MVETTVIDDYPAGHSMDSTWFAVDDDGEVGFFDTGEGGALPSGGFPCGLEAGGDDPLDGSAVLFALLQREARTDPELAQVVPATLDELQSLLDGEDEQELLLSLGVWVFACDEADAYPYLRTGAPRNAITLETLPPEMRTKFTPSRLPVKFREMTELAPGDYCPVDSWSGVWFDTQGKPHRTPRCSDEAYREAVALAEEGGTVGEPAAHTESKGLYDRNALVEFLRSRRSELAPAAPPARSAPTAPRGWLSRLFGKKP